METKANHLVVGVFTIFTIFLGVFSVYWLSKKEESGETSLLRFRISGSASGLTTGSIVSFNGVRVGTVQKVYINVSDPSEAIADAYVSRYIPIGRSTHAFVGLTGLSGLANIDMQGGKAEKENLFDEADKQKKVAEIIATPSPVTDLLQTAQDVFRRANNTIANLEEITRDIRKPLVETADAARKFSDSLARNSGNFNKFLSNFSLLSTEISNVANKIDGTIYAAEKILKAVDYKKVTSIVENLDSFSKNINNSNQKISLLIDKVDSTTKFAGNFFVKAEKAVDKANDMFSIVSPAIIKDSIMRFEKLIETMNVAAENTSSFTSSLNNRTQDIEHILKDARAFGEKLNIISSRADSVLIRIAEFIDSSGSKGIQAEFLETLRLYREVANTLNSKISTITDGFSRFSERGLRDIQNLIIDTSQSISRIERAITDFERNPQKVLGQGEGDVPRYEHRSRH